jgi:hypothetical protein
MRVGVLSSSQALDARPSTFIAKDDATYLVNRLAAERISSKLIRLFAADSPFRCVVPTRSTYIPARLPAAELPGVRATKLPRREMARLRGSLGTVFVSQADTMSLFVQSFSVSA